jgi:hypothetical protein
LYPGPCCSARSAASPALRVLPRVTGGTSSQLAPKP